MTTVDSNSDTGYCQQLKKLSNSIELQGIIVRFLVRRLHKGVYSIPKQRISLGKVGKYIFVFVINTVNGLLDIHFSVL